MGEGADSTTPGAPGRREEAVRRAAALAPVIAFAASLGLALALVLSQPVSSPWWITADADAIYTASGLNLLTGRHAVYLDHPGMPEQEALETVFGAQYVVERVTGSRSEGVSRFADYTLLHLDRARPVYRSLGVAFYLLGVVLAFLLVARLLGHWSWGFAASLLWVVAPGLLPISIQIRPDGLLCALVLAAGYLVARAAEQRSAWVFALAAVTVGFATTVKLHAAGLALVLLAAALYWHPSSVWPATLRTDAVAALRRRRRWLVPIGLLLLALAIILNLRRPAFALAAEERRLLVEILVLVGGYAALALAAIRLHLRFAQRLFDPVVAVIAVAVLIGLVLPMVFDPEDGLRMLVAIKQTLAGHGVNEGITPFSQLNWSYSSFPVLQGLMVFGVAMVALLVGLVRRAPLPIVFGSASIVLAVMALARYQQTYYLAPAFIAAMPAALWLFRSPGARAVPFYVWPLLAIVVVPQIQHRNDLSDQTAALERRAADVQLVAGPLLKPGVVAITPFSVPDVSYALIENSALYAPEYPYHYTPPYGPEIQLLESRGLKIEYYVGPQAFQVTGVADIDLGGGLGDFRVRRLPRFDDPAHEFGVLKILRAPPGL